MKLIDGSDVMMQDSSVNERFCTLLAEQVCSSSIGKFYESSSAPIDPPLCGGTIDKMDFAESLAAHPVGSVHIVLLANFLGAEVD